MADGNGRTQRAEAKLSALLDAEEREGPPGWHDEPPPEPAIDELDAPALDWPGLEEAGEPPPRQWAETGWIGHGHATLLAGEGGIGKTLLGQQWGSCFAIGRRLLHQDGPPLRVLMWACEDDHDELWRRQMAVCEWQDTRLGDYTNLRLVPRVGRPNTLLYNEFGKPQTTALMQTLGRDADAFQADVVILDNIAQLYAGGENDRPMVTFFVNALVGLLKSRAIVLLGHPAKALGSEFSGSTAWEASVRSRLYFGHKAPGNRAEPDDDEQDNRVLARRKANYAAKDSRKFQYSNGVFVPVAPPSELDLKLLAEADEANIVLAFKHCAGQEPAIPVPASSRGQSTFLQVFRLLPFLRDMQLDQRRNSQSIVALVERMQMDGTLERYEFRSKYKRPLTCLRLKNA